MNRPAGGFEACYAVSDLEEQVRKFWKVDNLPHCAEETAMSTNDRKVLDRWEKETTHDGTRYTVPLPLRDENQRYPNNRKQAEARLRSLGNRFRRDRETQRKYTKSVVGGIQARHSEKVDEDEPVEDGKEFYLSHHCVSHPRKKDEVRVVYECNQECEGISLNNTIHAGPDLLNRLLDVLLNFRTDWVVVYGDVEKMFSQILVTLKHRNLLRWLWWEDNDPDKPIVVYRMRTHLFGGIWAPSCANFTLQKTADDFGHKYDEKTVQMVKRRFYVDDGIKAESSGQEGGRLLRQVRDLLSRGGFNFVKISSNDLSALEGLPRERLAKSACSAMYGPERPPVEKEATGTAAQSQRRKSFGPEKPPASEQSGEQEVDENIEFILGNGWKLSSDVLTYKVKLESKPDTKRGVLSSLSSLYDPLGLASPIIVAAKKIFQECCRNKVEWDQVLTGDLLQRWRNWKAEVYEMQAIEFQRCVLPVGLRQSTEGLTFDLCMFSDASEGAYGACSFFVTKQEDTPVGSNLLTTKSRLAPIRQLSIPKLELNAAYLAVQMANYLLEALDVKITAVYFFTDSTIVLCFVFNADARHPTFISNRVSFIVEHTSVEQWLHVPTALNPADIVSRGCSVDELRGSYLWARGPCFLLQSRENWPKIPEAVSSPETVQACYTLFVEESEASAGLYAVNASADPTPSSVFVNHWSSWFKMKKALTYMVKFVRWRAKRKVEKTTTIDDLRVAEDCIIVFLQRDMLRTASPSVIRQYRKLYPAERDGILRVGGRLSKAPLHPDFKFPIVIPPGQPARALIWSLHLEAGHGGSQQVLQRLQQKYWVISARREVRRVLDKCFLCKRKKATAETPKMSDVPSERVQGESPPFTYTGVDYFGPILVKVARSTHKRYGCLFTCLQTRAIHLELSWSLSADSCMNAVKRFAARRGMPEEVKSDNGTNFVGRDTQAKKSIAEWNAQGLPARFLQKGCKWTFNPPSASHMGGIWERQIRTVRTILMTLVNEQVLTEEALLTYLCVVEDIVNSRPITCISMDPLDLTALTPNHLLRLNTKVQMSPGVFTDTDQYRQRWRQIQYLADIFWYRWQREYLPLLQSRSKWYTDRKSLSEGDIVIIRDEHSPRNRWPLGRVKKAYADAEGVVRVVDLHTITGELKRPVHKLCLIEAYCPE